MNVLGDVTWQIVAAHYELRARRRSRLEDYLDLALFYWESTDPGQAAAWHLEGRSMHIASVMWPHVLDRAADRFPSRIAPRFWQRYIDYVTGGSSFTIEECLHLWQREPHEMLPALFVFLESNGARASVEVERLRAQYLEIDAPRAWYVRSVLTSPAGLADVHGWRARCSW